MCSDFAFEWRTRVPPQHNAVGRVASARRAPAYARALRVLAAKAGRPDAYHETITIGFLALVGERLITGEWSDFARFERGNSDLFEKSALRRWYSAPRLGSPVARATFLLPDPLRP